MINKPSDQHNPQNHDHDENDADHAHANGDNQHVDNHQVALQIPIGAPQQAIIDKVMKDMDLALRKKKPSKIQQSRSTSN